MPQRVRLTQPYHRARLSKGGVAASEGGSVHPWISRCCIERIRTARSTMGLAEVDLVPADAKVVDARRKLLEQCCRHHPLPTAHILLSKPAMRVEQAWVAEDGGMRGYYRQI